MTAYRVISNRAYSYTNCRFFLRQYSVD